MEELKKKEFCEKYAGKKNKDDIKGAAFLTYICAAISVGLGFFMHNYSVLVDVVLIVGLALGVQIAKSRACAVLILIYACINTVIMSISYGRVSGWWLILAGVWAVRATFKLHKEYQKFLQDGTIPVNIEPVVPPQPKATAGQVAATFAPLAGMALGLLIIWLSVFSVVLEMLVKNAQSPAALLEGYRNWYIIILAAGAISVLLPVTGIIICIKKGMRMWSTTFLMVISLVMPLFLGGAMIAIENIPGQLSQANADLAQIKNGQLQEVTVWLSPKIHKSHLPGPYTKGQPEPVMDYGGISDDTNGRWVHFYVPDCLGFSLDQNALFDENESIEWNEEYAQKYRLCYTSNFNLVVSAEPVGQPALEPEGETQEYKDEYLSYEIPDGWNKSEEHSVSGLTFYIEEGHENDDLPDNISVGAGSSPYSLEDHTSFQDALMRQIAMQASSNDAKLSGSGSNTAQGYTLYTFTIEDADGTITQQYYILKDYVFCLVQVTSFSGSENKTVFEAAQSIVDSFVWNEDSQ